MKLTDAQIRRIERDLLTSEVASLRGGYGEGWTDRHRGECLGRADGFFTARQLIMSIARGGSAHDRPLQPAIAGAGRGPRAPRRGMRRGRPVRHEDPPPRTALVPRTVTRDERDALVEIVATAIYTAERGVHQGETINGQRAARQVVFDMLEHLGIQVEDPTREGERNGE